MRRRFQCALCRRERDPRLLRPLSGVDTPVLRRLRLRFGKVAPSRNVCPGCVQGLVAEVVRARGIEVLHERIQASWPLDAGKAYGVLPTPVRLHANPLFSGRGVTIAFIDSGFYSHPDLVRKRNRIKAYVDATTSAIQEYPTVKPVGSLSWHGLMTSSVAAGDGTCSDGKYRGLASESDLVLVKISNPKGGVKDPDIERGLRWVVENHRRFGIKVLNCSVGGDEEKRFRDSPIDRMVTQLVSEGVVVVAAAGNSGLRRLTPPASAPTAITVGGLDDQNLMDSATYRIWHSNYGPTVDGAVKPEVVAPSIWVAAPILPGTEQIPHAHALHRLATAPLGETRALFERLGETAKLRPGYGRRPPAVIRAAARRAQVQQQYLEASYKRVEGTSFAAPVVSSTAAVMLEACPGLTPLRLKEIMLATAEVVPGVEKVRQGYGVLAPAEAVARALREPGAPLEGLPLSPLKAGPHLQFLLYAPNIKPLAVVGGFNGWDPKRTLFKQEPNGTWTATLENAPAGTWRYKFLLEDGSWIDDPENPLKEPDGYGQFSTKVTVAVVAETTPEPAI